MKKHIIFLFLIIIHLPSWCQKSFTSTVPCSDSLLMSIKGKYEQTPDIILNDVVLGNVSTFSILPKAQQQEAFRRLDAMHKLLVEAYPEPKGLVGYWHRYMNIGLFAPNLDDSKGIPVCAYAYNCGFGYYACVQNQPKEVDFEAETMAQLNVYVNHLGSLQSDYHLDTMTINGQKVYMLNSIIGSWKGYDTYGNPGIDHRSILLTRKGESPFIPVTRKQYLDYCFVYIKKFFDDNIKYLQSVSSNPQDQGIINLLKTKNDVIKHYENELEKTKADNLLDSPVVISSPFPVNANEPIFSTGSQGGKMLVVENLAYIKMNLPKYIPQFMIMEWKWTSNFPLYGGAQSEYFRKTVEENFPVEKLQAMIDK